jgi:hypothetical protein
MKPACQQTLSGDPMSSLFKQQTCEHENPNSESQKRQEMHHCTKINKRAPVFVVPDFEGEKTKIHVHKYRAYV